MSNRTRFPVRWVRNPKDRSVMFVRALFQQTRAKTALPPSQCCKSGARLTRPPDKRSLTVPSCGSCDVATAHATTRSGNQLIAVDPVPRTQWGPPTSPDRRRPSRRSLHPPTSPWHLSRARPSHLDAVERVFLLRNGHHLNSRHSGIVFLSGLCPKPPTVFTDLWSLTIPCFYYPTSNICKSLERQLHSLQNALREEVHP